MMKRTITITLMLLLVFCNQINSKSLDRNNEYNSTVQDSKASAAPVMRNRVHKAGLFWLNVTNNGYFGNPDNSRDECTGRVAVSGELPGGSGTDFLFVGSLLFGGYLAKADTSAVKQLGTEFEGPYVTTAFEGWTGSPMPMEAWPTEFEASNTEAKNGVITESSNVEGKLSCADFSEVYDPLSKAEEQYTTWYTDKYVKDSDTGVDEYGDEEQNFGRPTDSHVPLGIEVKQTSYAWSQTYLYKFVIIDFTLYNRNADQKSIYDFFMGLYFDCDIGKIDAGAGISENHADDMGGFIQKWNKFDMATGQYTLHDLNMAWAADNDGRAYTGSAGTTVIEPGAGSPLTPYLDAVATVRVLRNPNPSLKYAFNMYVADSGNESKDWGPRWKVGLHGNPEVEPENPPVGGIAPIVWDYDLSIRQKGYDDRNYDNQKNGSQFLNGGRVEGRPAGDMGKYMVMSNDEFDYNQYDLSNIQADFEDPEYLDPLNPLDVPFMQAAKWQPWIITGSELPGQVPDGTEDDMNDLKNGGDTKFILSFGPLGAEKNADVAYDSDGPDASNQYESNAVKSKKVWEFAYGDSLKLTIAFIVNNGFHRSLEQDPNTGLDPELYQDGWEDAVDNVLWAEKVYDMPMTDTKIYDGLTGTEKSDGWYGEDVGADGLYADLPGDCWWLNDIYIAKDTGENDGKLTTFASTVTDIYGATATSEDNLLKKGNVYNDGGYGKTEEYGYMTFDYINNEWVRFGYNNEKVDLGDGVPDLSAPPPPPAPKVKVSTANNDVIVEWSSHEFRSLEGGALSIIGPEHTPDTFSKIIDFEGYKVMISKTGIDKNSFSILSSFDKLNYIYQNVSDKSLYLDFPFEVFYIGGDMYREIRTAVGVDSVEVDTVAVLPTMIDEENNVFVLERFGDNNSLYESHSSSIYDYSAASRKVVLAANDTVTVWDYKYVLKNVPFGETSYISVSAFDSGDPVAGVPADGSNPTVNKALAIPSSLSADSKNADKIWVVPNPYRGDVDYEAASWESRDGTDNWVEEDRKIVFFNVPVHSVLKIFTLAGDLVKTINHNGYANETVAYNFYDNAINWNLINENNQAVASGLYLYSVKDLDDDSFEHVGKFVIIK